MKKLFIGLLVFGSISAFAQDSEFERGYNEGRESCKVAQEAWHCSVKNAEVCRSLSSDASVGEGPSRASAILDIYPRCLDEAIEKGFKPVCTKL